MTTLLRRFALLLGLFVLFISSKAWAQTSPFLGITPTTAAAVNVGATLTLTINTTNTGSGTNAATNVVRTVTGLPTGLTGVTFGGAGSANAVYDPGAGTVSFTGGPYNLAKNGNTLNYTISFVVPAGTASFTAAVLASAANATNAGGLVTVSRVVTVNSTPVANNDAATVSYKSTALVNVLANDVATPGNPNLTTVFLSAGTGTPTTSRTYTDANGVVFTANGTTGNITFTNPNNFVGTATVGYNFKDRGTPVQTSNTGILTLTLTNAAPVAEDRTNVTVNANGTTTTLNPNLSAIDADGAGSLLSYQITSVPATGTLQQGGTVITAGNVPYTVLVANIGSLTYTAPSGASGSVSFQYRVTDNAGAQSGPATYTIPQNTSQADLGTTLAASVALGGPLITTAPEGSLLYYTATTTNSGPVAATNVVITIFLPTGLTGVSLSNSGIYNAANGRATFPAVGLGVGATFSRNIAFSMPGSTVNATASAVSGQSDPNPNNNIGATFTNPTQAADVSVAINGPTRVLSNQAVVYSVVPTNIGPSTATGVDLRAQLATGLAGVVASGPGAPGSGAYNAVTGVVTWPLINSLANGVSLVYTVRFNSPTATGGTITASASATSTTANGDPVAVNNDGTAAQSRITTQVVSAAATLLCVVPGADGDANPLPSGFNTYFPGVGTAATAATSLTLGPAAAGAATTPIVAGDLVLIIQMQGGDIDNTNADAYGDGVNGDNLAAGVILNANFTAGVYEYAIADNTVGTAGGTLQLTQGLSFGYVSAVATATSGQRRFQVIRVPRYRNVTLNANVTAPRWDGLTGGVMAMDVDGTLDLAGFKLDMAGRGFRGGAGQQLGGAGGVVSTSYRNSATLNTSANKGEGTTGTPRYLNDNGTRLDTRASGLLPAGLSDGYPSGDRGRGAPGNAGGGGTDGRPSANDQNTGGGGGSNAGRGGVGGNGWDSNSSTGGYGGAGFTQATASRIIMGGGGGAGTTNDGTVNNNFTAYPANVGIAADGFASSAAAGGGIVIIRATTVSANSGTIDVSGNSMNFVPNNDGSGGAGAGGSVVLLCNASDGNANSPVLQGITILANGGAGGSNTGGGSPHGPGGGGAGGVSFTSSVTNAASSLTPGPNGTTFGFATYGSGVASASLGQGLSSITRADVPNVVVGCPADVMTTISSSATANVPTNTATPNSAVTFTANTVNNGLGTARNVQETITIDPNLANVQPNGQSSFTTSPTGVLTFADGTTYNPGTGVVTFPAVAVLVNGATLVNALTGLPNRVLFSMPNQNVLGTAASRSSGDFDPRLANNDGSLPAANIRVTAVNSIAGTVFDDVNYGGGSGRDLATADASAVASGFAAGAIGSAGTRVELYNSSNAFIAATTTGADGRYGFSGVPVGTYTVRAVSSTVKSVRNKTVTGLVPVQTYRTNEGAPDPERVGGEDPTKVDGPANFSSVTLRLAGLNLSGGDNTAFIDQVEIVDAGNSVVATALFNSSFETPNVGNGFIYGPTGVDVAWTFAGNSGIAGNGSGFGAPAAPAGSQVAFLQFTGSADQALTLSPGTYSVRFKATQRNQGGQTNDQTVAVLINGVEIGRVQAPNDGVFNTYSGGSFTVGAVSGSVVTQSVAPLTLAGAGATGVDFGFNFDAVVNTNDTGQGSLRQFILNSNALGNGNLDQAASSNAGGTDPAPGVETSIFMISNGAPRNGLRGGLTNQLPGGVAVIAPNTAANGALPAFTDPNTVLDGTTQTLNVTNTNNVVLGAGGSVGSGSGTPLAQVNGPEVQLTGTPGQANSTYGLTLAASNLTVRGLAVLGFGNTGATGSGNLSGANIYVTGTATTGLLITNNVIGTGATAFPTTGVDPNTNLTRSTGNGVLLAGFATGGFVSAVISNNLIGYHGASGVENLANGTENSVLITGNEIRSNALLNATADGVHLGTAGGTVRNSLIIGNRGSGVDFAGTNGAGLVTGNTISGNGTGGAETSGVRAFGQGNTISLNVITGSAGNGVLVRAGTNAPNVQGTTFISQNSIFNNTRLGIDLLNTGDSETAGIVTLNETGDVDGGSNGSSVIGGNGLLNFPVIAQARINGPNLLVRGYARPGARIELFAVGTADASGFGEGATYLTAIVEGNSNAANGAVDSDARTAAYSGLVNGINQGADNTQLFVMSIPLASLPGGGSGLAGAVLSATATLAGVGTSEFSGVVTVGSGPLPVELVSFEARAVRNMDAALVWRTASEKNNDHFDVERSLNGTDFVKFEEVKGQGTSSAPTDYALTDSGIGAKVSGPVYYRLKQVDADGTSAYSPVRTVAFIRAAAAPAIGLFPNPATAATQLDLSQLPAGSYQVRVLDATGRTVLSTRLTAGRAHALDLNTIASGTYTVLVRGTNGGQVVNLAKRLIKE
ncbi:Ig-like domain-containing protein [Hymenobacter sp.]|uniref:Ig-like domain-containing protein n=1 Tax=Hymenobacter sp. TaxID=1898978 RepID=UPI00286A86AA|nr:Ig-like domain-containing protein [Hymenobacter sp.]